MYFDFNKDENGSIVSSVYENNEKISVFEAVTIIANSTFHSSPDDLKDPVIQASIREQGRDLFNVAISEAFYSWASENNIPIKAELLPTEIRRSLEKRGHTVLEIQNMSAETIANEHFAWHGYIDCGKTFLRQCNAIQAVEYLFTSD